MSWNTVSGKQQLGGALVPNKVNSHFLFPHEHFILQKKQLAENKMNADNISQKISMQMRNKQITNMSLKSHATERFPVVYETTNKKL